MMRYTVQWILIVLTLAVLATRLAGEEVSHNATYANVSSNC